MLRLYLRDPRSGLTVESPSTENWQGENPVTTTCWNLKEATGILAHLIAETENKPPLQVLMDSAQAPWEIVATWKAEEN